MKRFILASATSCLITSPAISGTVGVFGDSPFGFSNTNITNVYNTSITPGDHTASNLASLTDLGVSDLDLLWLTQPVSPYTADQLAVLNNYIDGGGRIAFLGEHGTLAPTQNNNINAALSALGSTMSITNVLLDPGFRDATRLNGQIQDDPLTVGVDIYNYAAFAPLNVGDGINLMFGSDLTNSMMAFENVRSGSIFMITDQNVFDNVSNTAAFDNGILFDNLVSGDTGNPNQQPPDNSGMDVIPLPAASWLLISGLGGLIMVRRKKQV